LKKKLFTFFTSMPRKKHVNISPRFAYFYYYFIFWFSHFHSKYLLFAFLHKSVFRNKQTVSIFFFTVSKNKNFYQYIRKKTYKFIILIIWVECDANLSYEFSSDLTMFASLSQRSKHNETWANKNNFSNKTICI